MEDTYAKQKSMVSLVATTGGHVCVRTLRSVCRACLTCAIRRPGLAVKPELTPIPVDGPFDRMGVDVIQFSKSAYGNRYTIVFMDYFTKWPEVFPASDQTTATIARLLAEEIIPHNSVPRELLSDRGLSKVICELYEILGIHKLNTSTYHPQTDGMVERFNKTLTDMLAKTKDRGRQDWDARLHLFCLPTRLVHMVLRRSPLSFSYTDGTLSFLQRLCWIHQWIAN